MRIRRKEMRERSRLKRRRVEKTTAERDRREAEEKRLHAERNRTPTTTADRTKRIIPEPEDR